jgi:hypothetical protein
MGYKIGIEIASATNLPLEERLSWHLQGNHYPPIDEVFIPVAVQAIESANTNNWDTVIEMPNGLSRTVAFIVENLHLEPFISDMEVPADGDAR